jgi:serine/threonine protein kinase
MIKYLDAPPKSFLQLCRHSEAFFDENGEYSSTSILYDCADVFQGNWKHGTIDAVRLEDRIEEGTASPEFFDFLRCALRWDPQERSSAAQLLEHAWLR